MKTRCTITLALFTLSLTACEPIKYAQLAPLPGQMSCSQLKREKVKAEKNLAAVHQQRQTVTTNDLVWFIADFGAGNNLVGSNAEAAARERLEKINDQAERNRCTIS